MKPFNVCPSCASVVDAPGAFCHRCQSKAESKAILRVSCYLMLVIFAWVIFANSCNGASADDLHWLAQRESGNRPNARGKLDELGLYQLRAIAVREVNRLKGTKFKHADALDSVKAPIIAGHYWDICASRTSRKTREGIHRIYRGLK